MDTGVNLPAAVKKDLNSPVEFNLSTALGAEDEKLGPDSLRKGAAAVFEDDAGVLYRCGRRTGRDRRRISDSL